MNEKSSIIPTTTNTNTTSTYIFYDVDKACVAAIEYVIFKYGGKIWFNAALNKVVTDTVVKSHDELCTIPFTIIKKENKETKEIQLSYKGYHYIIHQIRRYDNITNINNINSLIYKYILISSSFIIMLLIIIVIFIFVSVYLKNI